MEIRGENEMRVLSVGQVADALGVERWKIQKLLSRGEIEYAARIGPYRVLNEDDLPRVKQALVSAGYLRLADHLLGKK